MRDGRVASGSASILILVVLLQQSHVMVRYTPRGFVDVLRCLQFCSSGFSDAANETSTQGPSRSLTTPSSAGDDIIDYEFYTNSIEEVVWIPGVHPLILARITDEGCATLAPEGPQSSTLLSRTLGTDITAIADILHQAVFASFRRLAILRVACIA